ncbi:hypothetical protein CEXT_160091 [Caerostris extrusa]|uniref:Uncharacterized protein n=1 Tax=Caerostris extrusa TaxID=172846 RepID=A0AAV4UPN4_CAEEX|nr:hypothetical protein CEXT_160091 [Caerostris extrusa]
MPYKFPFINQAKLTQLNRMILKLICSFNFRHCLECFNPIHFSFLGEKKGIKNTTDEKQTTLFPHDEAKRNFKLFFRNKSRRLACRADSFRVKSKRNSSFLWPSEKADFWIFFSQTLVYFLGGKRSVKK